MPRHFLWGDLDPVSGAHMADGIAERLPAADLVRFADVGHWPQLEAPERGPVAPRAHPRDRRGSCLIDTAPAQRGDGS